MGDWVRFKLDRQTDHILVDEAQDTNERQWNIVRALALEYFAGEGASQRHRTIFTVGDYKQAIFGFQGTDPASFDVARAWFAREAAAIERDFLDLSMDRSFRSSPPILEVVDRVVEATRPRGARPAAPAQPARQPSCRPARLGDALVSVQRRARRGRGFGRGGLDRRCRPPLRRAAGPAGEGLARPNRSSSRAGAGRSGPRTS